MSGSYTTTKNYGFLKPNVNSDNDTWGDHLNLDLDTIDTTIHGIDTRAQVTSFNTRTGAVTLTAADVTAVGFATTTTNDASYINASGDTMSGPLALSGNAVSALQAVPLQQLNAALPQPGSATPGMDSVGAAGTSTLYARQDHIHPTDTSRYAASNPSGYQTAANVTTTLTAYAPLASPAFTGVPTTAATPAPGDSTTKLATTAFVNNAIGSIAPGVASFNTRTGAVTLTSTDVQSALTFAPAPLNAPVFTGDARAVTPAYADNDTSIATTAFVQSAVAPIANNAGRNLVMNGAFAVAQRGVGPWTITGVYTADRFAMLFSADTMSVSVVSLADADRTAIGDEAARYALQNVFTGSATANAYNAVVQRIENCRRLGSKTVVASFWARATSGTPKLAGLIYQNYGTGGSPSAGVTASMGATAALSTTWTRYTLSAVVPSTTGKTLGTNGDDLTQFALWCSDQANQAGGNIGVQSGTVYIWGIQLEIGTQATPFDAGGTPADQLRQCQRFYQAYGGVLVSGYNVANGAVFMEFPFPVTMRAVPTVGFSGASNSNASSAILNSATVGHLILQSSITATGSGYSQTAFTASADL